MSELDLPGGGGYLQFTPKRAMASFENLVALANHQERLKAGAHEARKLIWRDRGEPIVEVDSLTDVAIHAAKGSVRAGTLAFGIRAGMRLMLALLRMRKVPRAAWFTLVRHAIFGLETIRFAAMLGSFVGMYKYLINALPLLFPNNLILPRYSSSPFDDSDDEEDLEAGSLLHAPETVIVPLAQRTARLSLSKAAHMQLVRKKTRKWHALIAGAVSGGLAVLFETKSMRGAIGQQLFVRGLQGSYNAFSTKRGFSVPYGAVVVFSIACGQIMYGAILRPDTLPRAYTSWIHQAAKVAPEGIRMNRDLVRDGVFSIADVDKALSRDYITPENAIDLVARRALALAETPTFGEHYGPCSIVHPWVNSCSEASFRRIFDVAQWMFPMYGALHLIPAILFKQKEFFRNPGSMMKMLFRALKGTARSSAFLGVFVALYQSLFCYLHKTHALLVAKTALPRWIVDMLISKPAYWLNGCFAGLGLFIEEPRRREELAMYVLPKSLESFWVMARGRGLVFKTGNYGEALLTAIGMGLVMSTYQNDPQHLSGLVRRILYQFVGPN